nr:hypothetical protein L203_05272 [Cryptococcus depauperatus CBS 7841]
MARVTYPPRELHHMVNHSYSPYSLYDSPYYPPSPSCAPYAAPPPPPMAPYHPYARPKGRVMFPRRNMMEVKAFGTNKPTGTYQPSRGAQRDVKHSQRIHLQIQRESEKYKKREAWVATSSHAILDESAGPGSTVSTFVPREEAEWMRREQQSLIEKVRKSRMEKMVEQDRSAEELRQREEAAKKQKRIMLQVFVHARTAHCSWRDCEASLNSWALLEKHIHRCHFHKNLRLEDKNGNVRCHWAGCQLEFPEREKCHEHVLRDHMQSFSARCPFKCSFEGEDIQDLMKHVVKSHPTSTPDDFVPGLLHFRPSNLSASQLPPLPDFSSFQTQAVRPFTLPVGNRMKKMITRRCCAGKYPKLEAGYEEKRGAGAALAAFAENSKKLRQVKLVEDPIKTEDGESIIPVQSTIELLDIEDSADIAREKARKEVAERRSARLLVTIPSSSDSTPLPSEAHTPTSPCKNRRTKISLTLSCRSLRLKSPKQEKNSPLSSDDSLSESTYSEHRPKRNSPVLLENEKLKRSERLMKRQKSVREYS